MAGASVASPAERRAASRACRQESTIRKASLSQLAWFARSRSVTCTASSMRSVLVGAVAMAIALQTLAVAGLGTKSLYGTTDNGLGRLVTTCASAYCSSGADALDLWLSLNEVCTASDSQNLQFIDRREGWASELSWGPADGWSFFFATCVCAVISTMALFVGWGAGARAAALKTCMPLRRRKIIHSPLL